MRREDIDAMVDALKAAEKATSRVKGASIAHDYVVFKTIGTLTEAARLTGSAMRRMNDGGAVWFSFTYRGVTFVLADDSKEVA